MLNTWALLDLIKQLIALNLPQFHLVQKCKLRGDSLAEIAVFCGSSWTGINREPLRWEDVNVT